MSFYPYFGSEQIQLRWDSASELFTSDTSEEKTVICHDQTFTRNEPFRHSAVLVKSFHSLTYPRPPTCMYLPTLPVRLHTAYLHLQTYFWTHLLNMWNNSTDGNQPMAVDSYLAIEVP